MNPTFITSKIGKFFATKSSLKNKLASTMGNIDKPMESGLKAMDTISASGISARTMGGILVHSKKTQIATMKKLVNEIISNSRSMQDDASKMLSKTKVTFNEVSRYIEQGLKNSFADVKDDAGNLIRKFEVDDLQGKKIARKMQEYNPVGELSRESSIGRNLEPETITAFVGKTKRKISIDTEIGGKSFVVNEGYEELADGGHKAAKKLISTPDKMTYLEDVIGSADGNLKFAKSLTLEPKLSNLYKESGEVGTDGYHVGKELFFDDMKSFSYKEYSKDLASGQVVVNKELSRKDGKLMHYK